MYRQINQPERSTLPERQKLALMFAELYITSPEAITDSFFEELKLHFKEGELVEIMFFLGTMNMLHRFNTAIDLSPPNGEELFIGHYPYYSYADTPFSPPQKAPQAKAGTA